MKSWMLLAAVVLCGVASSPLAAQQAPVAAPAAPAAAPRASTSATLPGPRVRPNLRQADPAFKTDRESFMRKENHTIVVSTLVIVLVVIILVLLIV